MMQNIPDRKMQLYPANCPFTNNEPTRIDSVYFFADSHHQYLLAVPELVGFQSRCNKTVAFCQPMPKMSCFDDSCLLLITRDKQDPDFLPIASHLSFFNFPRPVLTYFQGMRLIIQYSTLWYTKGYLKTTGGYTPKFDSPTPLAIASGLNSKRYLKG
ncbi:hypothetical protein BABINDRAFT_153390 [Babjeviella inositovora NRRL Y-12698]|uniref:Uncharacterized protein n=1 Tax=Babjeviella inositovora NRRL Y-12698 TaxID=984486 RepID=A0A1E3QM80_9ASCO|nr:uncharacterized protein BABINDRAFT_153390 [Babjeviella inositovora NRRL Y-12698]ODQ78806.1 hypothetical protein BABINDRAFT_153390 [Babjeviella inositovora NRRL Y-12698]